MGLDAAGVNEGLAGFVSDVFKGAGSLAVSETGKVLRDGVQPPVGGYLVPSIGVEIGRRACKRYADNSGAVGGSAASNLELLCRPYLDDIGYGSGPSIAPPFQGGQCAGNYLVWGQFDGVDQQIGGLTPRNIQGPLVLIAKRDVAVPGQPFADSMRTFFDFQTASGVESIGVAWRTSFPGTRTVRPESTFGPDVCGNPPPEVVGPVAPGVPLPPGPTPFNPSPDINVDIDVDIEVDPITGPKITFDIGVGPVEVDLFPEGGGGGGGGGGGPANPPGDVGQPGEPSEPGPGGGASGCAGPNQVLAGLRVDILGTATGVSQYDPQVYRGACYVYMGNGQVLGLIPEGVALRSGQFFFPPADNLTCWEVRANFGFNLRTTPYYRTLEPETV